MSMGFKLPGSDIVIDDVCPSIIIESIIEDSSKKCEYFAGQACTNTHTFIPILKNAVGTLEYEWSTTLGTVVGDSTSSFFTVDITYNQNVAYNIKLIVQDQISGAVGTYQFISEHILGEHKDCIVAYTDLVWNGYEKDNYGVANFETTEFIIYAVKWITEDKRFVVRIGNTGDNILPDVQSIDIKYLNKKYVADWNSSENWYECNTEELFTHLDDQYEICNRQYCFSFFTLPGLIISTNFKELT